MKLFFVSIQNVRGCVSWAYDIVSYRSHAPESNLIEIVSQQTSDIGKNRIVVQLIN